MYDLDLIRERVDLRTLAEEAGAQFRSGSSNCPLHGGSDNPTAFHLYDGGKRWHCFTRCSEPDNDGDIFNFYMRWKGLSFGEAAKELAARARVDETGSQGVRSNGARPEAARAMVEQIEPPSGPGAKWQERAEAFVTYTEKELAGPGGQTARAYLGAERGLNENTLGAFRVGYCPKDIYDAPENWFEKESLPAPLSKGGEKRIWLPRGIVIPGEKDGKIWYIKVRRPMGKKDDAGFLTDPLAAYLEPVTSLPEVKFGGPRGGQAVLFGADLRLGFPVLVLTEGEWDCMLAWQEGHDFCDVATLGGSKNRADLLDLSVLACYPAIVAVYDADEAGDQAREYWQNAPGLAQRVTTVAPPDHDLSDYWSKGGDLRKWLAEVVAGRMGVLLAGLDRQRFGEQVAEWEAICRQLSAIS